MIYVVGYNDVLPDDAIEINTTSRSTTWSKGLSPFFLGPVHLYGGYSAQNVENAWQFSKVYPNHVGADKLPNRTYFEWAKKGWADTYAHRYPMGKGAVPLYSWWDGDTLDYIEARETIYIPLYAEAVKKSETFANLKSMYKTGEDIYLRDFDGYNFRKLGLSFEQVINDPKRKMGHAFVLAMLLEEYKGI